MYWLSKAEPLVSLIADLCMHFCSALGADVWSSERRPGRSAAATLGSNLLAIAKKWRRGFPRRRFHIVAGAYCTQLSTFSLLQMSRPV